MSRSQDDKGSVMFRKFLISLLFLSAFCSMVSFAAGKKMIQVDSAYVEGKVNDPVTKSARVAYIVTENPTVSFDLPEGKKAEVFSYCNSYLESEDRGIRNRLLRKTVGSGEKFTLLPDEEYSASKEDGSLYDATNHCYVLRVYEEGSDQFEEYYFGIVEENIFKDFQAKAKEREALLKQKMEAAQAVTAGRRTVQ